MPIFDYYGIENLDDDDILNRNSFEEPGTPKFQNYQHSQSQPFGNQPWLILAENVDEDEEEEKGERHSRIPYDRRFGS